MEITRILLIKMVWILVSGTIFALMKIIQELLGYQSSITRIHKRKNSNERIRKGLKYKVPSILDLKLGKLNDEQIGFFRKFG